MRHRDYIFDSSVSRKRRLIPSDYMLKLTETLDNLPEVPGEDTETKVRVIEHDNNRSMAAWVTAAAVCIMAVTGGMALFDKDSSFSGSQNSRNENVPVSTSGFMEEFTSAPVTSGITESASVTSVTTAVTSVTSATSVSAAGSVTSSDQDGKPAAVIAVTVATRGKEQIPSDAEPENKPVPENPSESDHDNDRSDKNDNSEDINDNGNKEEKPEVTEVPEHQKPDVQESTQKPAPEKPAPEKPAPNKNIPDEKQPAAHSLPMADPKKNTENVN